MCYIPDNYDRWEQHNREQEAKLDKLPRCSECDEPIQDEYCYYINGEYICEECMEQYKVSTDLIEGM